MSMADLVAAGAPELPEGWFYRVKRAFPSSLGFKVEIREQHRFTSSMLLDTFVLEQRHDDMTEALVDACRRAAARLQERSQEAGKFAALAEFIGDHDPKGGRA